MNGDFVHADGGKGGAHNAQDLKVGGGAVAAHGVDVALHELPVAAGLWLFAPPDFRHVIALKREVEL